MTKYAIVISRFNKSVTDLLLDYALKGFQSKGVKRDQIDIYWVPGAFEIAGTLSILDDQNKYQGYVALGAVIRGETYHFECIANQTSMNLSRLSVSFKKPLIFGILTTNTIQQALDRVCQGEDYALHAIEMVELYQKIIKTD